MSDRLNYLIECSKTARDELIFRIKHRDTWLTLQLFVQAILWAISNGIKLGGVDPLKPLPWILELALPISLVFISLYFVEDGLIHRLSKYVGSLSEVEKKIAESDIKISCWDASLPLRSYAKGINLFLRIIAQTAGFIILPGYLTLSYDQSVGFKLWPWTFIFQIVVSLVILISIFLGYRQRSNTGQE